MRRGLLLLLIAVTGFLLPSGGPQGSASGNATQRVLIACLHEGEFLYSSAPADCDFFQRLTYQSGHGQLVLDISTKGLKWTGWGRASATAKGRDAVNQEISVVAYHQIHCGRPTETYYKFVKIRRTVGGTPKTMKLASCGQTRFRPPKELR